MSDFALGERRRFAVGFFANDLHEGGPGLKHANALGEGRYEVSGEVIVAEHGLAVLDFGLLAYCDSQPPSAARGHWLAGRVALEVECYSYFEIHARRSSACLQPRLYDVQAPARREPSLTGPLRARAATHIVPST
jgi:hypothetical protein